MPGYALGSCYEDPNILCAFAQIALLLRRCLLKPCVFVTIMRS